MSLSWNEIRVKAKAFSEEFAEATYEKGDTQTFYNEFFEVFGIKRRQVARYEEHIKKLNNKSGFIDLFWPKVLLVEQKSTGRSLAKAGDQAGEYFDAIKDREKPRFQLLCDFQNFELLDRDTREEWTFTLSELSEKVDLFAFMLGREKRKYSDQDPVNIEASELMGAIHDDLEESGYCGHDLEVYLVRLLFMLFADDTGIFPRDHLLDVIESRTSDDGSDLGGRLNEIFHTLNTPEDMRNKNLDEDLNIFPYVNGDLFSEILPPAYFTSAMRERFLEACRFSWQSVSPAIFGSLFQSVMDPEERRKIGAHYTTEKNIRKLIGPLFLDELQAEFEHLKNLRIGRAGKIEAFRRRLGTLTFLDPACGCGNFLIITYRELRQLELECLKTLRDGDTKDLFGDTISTIDVDQFYGIELEEFPARIAEVAMWMIDHIMNREFGDAFGLIFNRIPLKKSPHIVNSDALELDWNDLLPAHQCSYVLGNPPFIGQSYQSKEQREALRLIVDPTKKSAGPLDFVTGWFIKAGKFIENGKAKIAFVTTNSITQGEQVALLWPILFDRLKLEITFAHRTFEWGSEARGKAHVHVVIIGLTRRDMEPSIKRLFEYETLKAEPEETHHKALTAYLFGLADGANRYRVVKDTTKPISERPRMMRGAQSTDGGHYIFRGEERDEFLAKEPAAKKFLRPYIGAQEYLNNKKRWILDLEHALPEELAGMPHVIERINLVREMRLKSKKLATQKLGLTPTLLESRSYPTNSFLMIPRVSSERRDYIPMEWEAPPTIPSDATLFMELAGLFQFGILTSTIHMAWLRNIGGRLKSDYRYSIGLVYNTFPWPELNPKKEAKISELAQAVLDARDEFPDSTLADLYDPDLMPPVLRKAHTALDKAVDKLYRAKPFESERERVEHLFMLYEKMAAPIEAAAKEKPKRRRKSAAPKT